MTAVPSGRDQPAMVGALADDGSLPVWAARDVHIGREHGGQMVIAEEGGGLPVSVVGGQGSVGTQIVVAAVGSVHGQALIGMNDNLAKRYRPVVDAAQAAARGVHLVQHGLRSGWRERGGACSGPTGRRGRNAVNSMSAAAGRCSR